MIERHAIGLDDGPSGRGRAAARGRSSHRSRERRRPRRRRLVRRVRAGRDRRAAPPSNARGPDRADAGGRHDRRHRSRQRRAVRGHASRRSSRCRTTTPCSPARRARRTTARRTSCSRSPSSCGCRWCSSPRAAVGGPATPTASASPGSTACAFLYFAQLSGLVPLVGINAGYCFAGNAAMLGCCDVVIATEDSNIGMGGPAMIEGGGLGVFDAEGGRTDRRAAGQRRDRRRRAGRGRRPCRWPSSTCRTSRGAPRAWEAPDQTLLRDVVPEDRKRVLRRARGDRGHLRHRVGARAAPRLRSRDDHLLRARRGSPGRRRGEQPDAPRRRDRQRRRGQGGAVHAAVRRVRHPARHAGRHARDDGRSGGGADRAGPPLHAPVRRRRQRHRAADQRRSCASRTGSARRR